MKARVAGGGGQVGSPSLYTSLAADWEEKETGGDPPPPKKRHQLFWPPGKRHVTTIAGLLVAFALLTTGFSSYPHNHGDLRSGRLHQLHAWQGGENTPRARGGPLDALIVPGGGLTTQGQPHPFVQLRLDRVAEIYLTLSVKPKIIVLSGGTTHKPPPRDGRDFPITEAAASARYLLTKHAIPSYDILEEGFSLDTIGNAYWLRTVHTDSTGLRKLQVVTNEFHALRTKAIFDFVFSLPSPATDNGVDSFPYELSYVNVPNEGMTTEALEARKARERESAAAFHQRMKTAQIQTMADLHSFVFSEHMAYASPRLEQGPSELDETIKGTY